MKFTALHAPALAIAILLCVIAAYPLVSFYRWGWRWKRQDILVCIEDPAKILYLERFHKVTVPQAEAGQKFNELYDQWYGRHHLKLPTAILVLLIFVQAIFLGEFGLDVLFPEAGYKSAPGTAMAAFSGAYLFIVADFIARDRRRDITASDIQLGALRIALAIAIGYAFAAIAQEDIGPLIAFAAGAFPLSTIKTVMRRTANKRLGLEVGPDSLNDQVGKLSGVDPPLADRIGDTGITTIAQLAYCDPVQLTMQTNLAYSFVMDVVGQALAWVYLEDKLTAIRASGLRGALEIKHFYADLTNSAAPAVQAEADGLLDKLAVSTGQSKEGLRNSFKEIAGDPYTDFLDACWS